MAPAVGPYVMIGMTTNAQIVWFSVGSAPPFRSQRFLTAYANLAEFLAERLEKASRLEVIRVYAKVVEALRKSYPEIAALFPDAPKIPPEIAEDEIWNATRSI